MILIEHFENQSCCVHNNTTETESL